MKKIAILSLVLLLTLCACGKQEAAEMETTSPPATEAVVETSVETTAPVVTETKALPEETEQATEPVVEVPTEPEGVPGTVTARSLNVREKPSVNAKRVAQLSKGTSVTIYEEQFVAGMTWGRIDEGWVSMNFILKGQGIPEQQNVQKPTESKSPDPLPFVPAPAKPDSVEPKPNEPKPTETTPTETTPSESKPAETKPDEQKPIVPTPTEPPAPTQCQHQWNAIQNIPAEYEYTHYVLCVCGSRFPDTASWRAHSDSFSGEKLLNHTGYASGSDKTEVSPPMTKWQCAHCGVTKTISSWDNP